MDRRRRMEILREIIKRRAPVTQKELVELLAREGVRVDQSTVSRDLREMGVVRLPGGGYALPGEEPRTGEAGELARGLSEYALSVEPSGNLIVVRTAPGNAHALAVIIDRARLGAVAGTVAGDDTILVVVREGHRASELALRFREEGGLP